MSEAQEHQRAQDLELRCQILGSNLSIAITLLREWADGQRRVPHELLRMHTTSWLALAGHLGVPPRQLAEQLGKLIEDLNRISDGRRA